MQRETTRYRAVWSAALLFCAAALLLPRPAAAQVTEADALTFPALPTVDIPQPERIVLDNGLVVLLLEDHELPLIEVRALVRAGSRWEPAGEVGLAELTADQMRSGGTASLGSDELDDLLEDRAAVIEVAAGITTASADLNCLTGDFAEMLGVFADILRRPAFDPAKLAVAKTQMIAGIARQNDSAPQIVAREFAELVYGEESPYARQPTYATVAAIDRADLVAWHERYYQPQGTVLGVVGDFARDEALALVRRHFGDWPRGAEIPVPEVAIRDAPHPGVFFVEKNDVTQSYIRIGHLGIRRDHPDYYALEVMNQVLGGSFAARLFTRVRSQQGLAYSVYGLVTSQYDFPGISLMAMSTKVGTTVAGIRSLLAEARNMTTEPPTAEEVEKARANILNSFVFRADSTAKILRQQLLLEHFDYPRDWLERYRAGIEGLTLAEVRAAAEKHVRPGDFTILVVGPAAGTDEPLSALGEVHPVDVTIPPAPAAAEAPPAAAGG